MKERDPYQLALRALTGFAGGGRFGWGEPLVVTALANELGLSPTPVREALARLSGEGLIEHRPGRGYYAPSPSADDLADLWEMHRRLVHWALDLLDPSGTRRPLGPDGESSAERLFIALARAPGHEVLARAHWRTTLQLRPVRAAEAQLAADDQAWIAKVSVLVGRGDITGLEAEVDAYHATRVDRASAVLAVMRRAAQSIEQI